MNLICPKDCENRSPTCHGECQKYLDYFQENVRKNDEKAKSRAVDEYQAIERRKSKIAKARSIGKFNYRNK